MQSNHKNHTKLLVFLAKVKSILEDNLTNEQFSISYLCQQLGYSRMQLHRNIKAATGLSTTFYIRQFRIKKACELLLKNRQIRVQEVVYAVGYKDPSYFVKVFVEVVGETPRRWQRQATKLLKSQNKLP